jgi:pimeloyl-ACP methyl ester carboxylesterase
MPQKTMKILSVLFAIIFLMNASLLGFAQKTHASKSKQNNSSSVNKPHSRYLQTDSIRIHYLEWNQGGDSTIILLHGLYDNADTWSTVAALLARDYRVIALDRRGAGLTDKPDKGYDFQTLAGDVLSFINKLNLQRVCLVGHSAGAGVALTVAATEPEKIDSVVLVDGGFWAKRTETSEAKPTPPCSAKPVDCKRVSAIERGSMDYDSESLYARVSVPALLIMGIPPKLEAEQFAREVQEAQSHVEKIANEKLQSGKMVVIRETSHWIQRDQPSELASVIKSFYK